MAAEFDLEVGKDLCGNMGCFLVDLLYNVRKNPNNDHAKYALFRSCDLKTLLKFWEMS